MMRFAGVNDGAPAGRVGLNQSTRGCLKGRTLCEEILSEVGTFVPAGYSIRTIINWSVYSAIREVYRTVTG